MNRGLSQSTLRQLQSFLAAPRFWLTIVIVALVFTVAGPFGTGETMPFARRAAFWLMLHLMAFSLAAVLVVAADGLLENALRWRLARMMIGAILAALPIGAGVEILIAGFTGETMTLAGALDEIAIALMLSPLLCALTYLTAGVRDPVLSPAAVILEARAVDDPMSNAPAFPISAPVSESGRTTPPPILARLKPEHRGPLLSLSVEDHYTEVVTTRGRELVLLRFSDALGETGETEGLRIHRSHWIADRHIEAVRREKGKLVVLAADGRILPVSRPYEAAVRERAQIESPRSRFAPAGSELP